MRATIERLSVDLEEQAIERAEAGAPDGDLLVAGRAKWRRCDRLDARRLVRDGGRQARHEARLPANRDAQGQVASAPRRGDALDGRVSLDDLALQRLHLRSWRAVPNPVDAERRRGEMVPADA